MLEMKAGHARVDFSLQMQKYVMNIEMAYREIGY